MKVTLLCPRQTCLGHHELARPGCNAQDPGHAGSGNVILLYTFCIITGGKKCPPVPQGVNSDADSVKKGVGTQVNYVCRQRYPIAVAGSNSIVCQEDLTWSGEPLECGMIKFVIISLIL